MHRGIWVHIIETLKIDQHFSLMCEIVFASINYDTFFYVLSGKHKHIKTGTNLWSKWTGLPWGWISISCHNVHIQAQRIVLSANKGILEGKNISISIIVNYSCRSQSNKIFDNLFSMQGIGHRYRCEAYWIIIIIALGNFNKYTALQKFGITLVSWSTRGNTATQMIIFFFKNITQNIFKFRMINATYMITTRPWSYLQKISIIYLI